MSCAHISKIKRCSIVKSSTFYFHMKTKILLDFQVYISVPLRSDICDYSGAYTVANRRITIEGENDVKTKNKNLLFKNNVPFRSCISNITYTFVDNAEGIHIFMPMYNLLEYSDIYFMTSGSLWNYYIDEINDHAN